MAQYLATPSETGSPVPSLDQLPRINLLHVPTPLEPLPRLSAGLGGPQLGQNATTAPGSRSAATRRASSNTYWARRWRRGRIR
jgi:hypothetical protein